METKNNSDAVLQSLHWLDYPSHHLVPPHSPGAGGLALFWKQSIEVEIINETHQFIDTRIKAKGRYFFSTFLYGEPDRSRRVEVWDHLQNHVARPEPWFITGDFNDIIHGDEKEGGPPRPEGSFSDLRSFMSSCDLYDLKHTGNFLSWRGKRHTHLVRCRLDRAMANSEWALAYPSGRSEYLRFEGSDHRPLVTSFDPIKKTRKGLFRYDRSLKDNIEVKNLVIEAWENSPNLSVESRLQNCRAAIINWSKEHHLNSQKEIFSLRDQLEEAMCDNQVPQENIEKLNQKLLIAYRLEEEFWKQRSRQLWLALGDKNTGYFHAATKGRRAINNISVIESNAGIAVYEEQDIVKEISDYYLDIFTSKQGDRISVVQEALKPCVTSDMNEKLIVMPTADEIKQACFSVHADKAPGPDGFSASFFQSNWETVGDTIIAEVQAFFISGSLPSRINHTHVRLIPKIPSPKRVADYRPIALCSVYYKVIAKLLAKRLQNVLHSCISENQSAFVPLRAITDNVLITHETLHYLKSSGAKKRVFMAVKTDMSKAYDRLEWDFIKATFDRLGFHQQWVSWIMQCISTVSYSYLLNGQAKGLVVPERGIRQGDPLSPYIFIICSEVLSGLCNKAQQNGSLPGIRVSKGSPRVNHLLFADDTMFFCRSDKQSCQKLKSILQKYENASGQQINQAKSTITFSSKTDQATKETAKLVLQIYKIGGQGKYLGLPELFGRKKKDLFSLIVDRIKQRALSWSSRFLSSAGKLTLLKSVLAAIPAYTMTCFQLPNSLHKRIQSALTRFWWDANLEKRKMCWISWKKMTKSFKTGGLGFRDIKNFNNALLAKISWRILTKPSCLLAKVLLGKYCKNSSFLDCQVPNSASHGWRSICAGRDLLNPHLGKMIGSGDDTPIWRCPWLSLNSPVSPMGPPSEASQFWTVADLRHHDTLEWNVPLIKKILPLYEEEILSLQPSTLGAPDTWAWLPAADGVYSTKSGYFESLNEEDKDSGSSDNLAPASFEWKANIWGLKCSPKTKLLLWKTAQNALPVGSNLQIRHISDSVKCPHCNEEETELHLFFHCPFASLVWKLAPFKETLLPENISSITAGISLTRNLTCLPPSGVGDGPLAPWIFWTIWTSRNQLIFNKKRIPAEEAILCATLRAKEWQQAQSPKIQIQTRSHKVTPIQAPTLTVQCFTDAAWKDASKAGLGWIFKDQGGRVTQQGSTVVSRIRSPLVAEAMATLSAIRVAIESGFTNISFASDSQVLVKALNRKLLSKDLHGILFDILTLYSAFSICSFNFIPRIQNSQADSLAKNALGLDCNEL